MHAAVNTHKNCAMHADAAAKRRNVVNAYIHMHACIGQVKLPTVTDDAAGDEYVHAWEGINVCT